MTYCVGMLLDAGMVFLADSRTNAGVDHISTFRKTFIFERSGERVLVLMTSGNLAVTQAMVSMLRSKLNAGEDVESLYNVPDMFAAARHVGETLREVHQRDAEGLAAFSIEFNASIILGGQIKGEAPRLFTVYAAGNFIEATPETTYFQIGESKYGKPIIDRTITRATPMDDAVKCALISMDSTIKSNLSVGLPLDLVCVRSDAFRVALHQSIDAANPYFSALRTRWGESLRHAFDELPRPDWLADL
ncbi:proteasome-type protease [Uliginosibacterium sediminicola]|uniref:Proteasome-type protease n=1 Tax=Uliginosibacterium sediminicola TaxID=2024550 RepID=A0ABU9YVF8_9RHOO